MNSTMHDAPSRDQILKEIQKDSSFDIFIIGGGATGLGCALDAVSRGLRVLLVEQVDYGKGTSSKSTKLIHGGVRYLEQGDVLLVYEALKERGRLLKNAPHLVSKLKLIIPSYSLFGGPYYAAGLKLYDLLSRKYSFGGSEWLSASETLKGLKNLKSKDLKGGVSYFDGQFDDTRMLIALARTIWANGGLAINYMQCDVLEKNKDGKIIGAQIADLENGTSYNISCKTAINCTGAYSKKVLEMDGQDVENAVLPSQGAHIVVSKEFLPSKNGLLIPKTDDGRVLFALPWHGHTLIGTTDIPVTDPKLEPLPTNAEIDFILETTQRFLKKAPQRSDVLSVFAGIRPLALEDNNKGDTKTVSRNHKITVSKSGLISVTGGKWTTFRKMAEDAIDKALINFEEEEKPESTSAYLKLHGYTLEEFKIPHASFYGTDWQEIVELGDQEKLHPKLPYLLSEVRWQVRNEMARTVEDVLARRMRILFLDAQAAIESSEKVADILSEELGRDTEWKEKQLADFRAIADKYLIH